MPLAFCAEGYAQILFCPNAKSSCAGVLDGGAVQSQSIPLFGRHAVFRLDVVGDLCILPRTRAQREVALLTAPDIELMADQIRRDARQQIRRLLRVDNA